MYTRAKVALLVITGCVSLWCPMFVGAATTNSVSPRQDNVYDVAQLVLTESHHTIKAIETIATLLSVFLGVVGAITFVMVLLYKSKIERIEDSLRDSVSGLKDVREAALALGAKFVDIQKEGKRITEDLLRLENEKEELRSSYKEVASLSDALHATYHLRSSSNSVRIMYMQKLMELVHPVGVPVMLGVLTDSQAGNDLRGLAALGLSRYSKNEDCEQFWGQIIDCYVAELNESTLPEAVAVEVVVGVAKYKSHARAAIQPMLNWSRHEKAEIRRVCAEAFGSAGIWDQRVIQRLEEMKVNDKATEVQAVAVASLESLRGQNLHR